MRVRFLLVQLPFQRSMILVIEDVEGEWGGAIPIVAPGETVYEDQIYHFVQEMKAGRPVREAQELGVFEFPDLDAVQEAARSLAQNLKTAFWDEEEALASPRRSPDHIDTVLLLTVGGSTEPLTRAIRGLDLTRSFVFFICSADSKVLVEGGPGVERTLPEVAGLSEAHYELVVWENPDDLAGCVEALFGLHRLVRTRFPGAHVVANYTGGTKTMSAALVIGAVLLGWELQLNVGVRPDLRQVLSGTDVPARVAADEVLLRLELRLVRAALDRYDYVAAASMLHELLRTLSLDGARRAQVLLLYQIVQGLAAWDLGQYQQALAGFLLAGERGQRWLSRLQTLAEAEAVSWERVADLLLNAERRACQGRYDEAALRLYRAMELFAATRLRQAHGIEAGLPTPSQLPESLRSIYALCWNEAGQVRPQLELSYRLLEALDDPVGRLFGRRRQELREALARCRRSPLLEGSETMDPPTYEAVRSRLEGFIREVARRLGVTLPAEQLPRADVLEWVELG